MKKIKILLSISIVFFGCFFTSFLSGQQLNLSDSTNRSVWPTVAVNKAGEVMVVWSEWMDDGAYYRIYKNGQWSDKIKAGVVQQQAWSNQIAVDSTGMFHLSWADGYGSLYRDIWYSYYSGSSWAPAERVYDSSHNSAWNRIDIDTNDDIYVQWYHKYMNEANVSDIVSISKSKFGTWPASYENVSRSLGHESIHTAFRVRNGNVYSCYMDRESPRRLYFTERKGGSWSSPIQIAQGYWPALEIDSSENVHVVWSGFDGRFHYRGRVNGAWGSEEIISTGYAPPYFCDLRGKSDIIVANWVEDEGKTWGIYLSAKIAGYPWLTPVRVGETLPLTTESEHLVQVALDDAGCAHCVWHGVGPTGDTDIFYAKYCINLDEVSLIDVDKSSFDFETVALSNPSPQTFQVRNMGKPDMNYTIASDKTWLAVEPATGASAGEWDSITVNVDSSSLQTGTYSGTLSVSSATAYNSPITINVNLTIHEVGATLPPFGGFDSPASGTVVAGNTAVTGWALDDVGVESVKIYRNPVGTENPPDGRIYIGDAVFIEGARPDVEQAYPGYPQNSRAGWGYMMLSNFLPNGGNGDFTLLAVATDIEGNEVQLGQKSIVGDNTSAVKPFGTIDAPLQGGTASGAAFSNWAWVLTPMPNAIPTDGSTIKAWVDGVEVGSPTYNLYRSDIATLFPGYANSDGAVGVFYLDTTAYSDGVHTLQWSVVDNAGNSDGIGSRYFSIQNAAAGAMSL